MNIDKDYYDEDVSVKNEDINLEILRFIKEGILYRKDSDFIFDFEKFSEDNPELSMEFSVNPIKFINTIKFKLNEHFGKIKLRIFNYETEEDISNFRTSHLGKLFKVRGMISKTNKVIALVKESSFECASCGGILKIIDSTRIPNICSCGEKNQKRFKLIDRKYRDVQEIEIEESQDKVIERQPQKIRIRLYDELTDTDLKKILQPGNKVEILGVLEEIPIISSRLNENLFEYRLVAIDVLNQEEIKENESINEEDLKLIKSISERNPLELLSENISPEIIGYKNVKKTLVLQQVGGIKKKLSDGKLTRDKIHILLIGDAGVSKTELVKSVHLRTPKAYYTSGEQTSAVGLTATVIKDELTGAWGLQAGAMPKANGSILVVDEIEKSGEQTLKALHTPLESGIIPINKAGINTTLSADCSLLAVANPKGGRFDTASKETLVKQINMPPTLLSRFDIIHIMKDEIDEKKDSDIIESFFSSSDKTVEIPTELYRKYIIHARNLKPKLKHESIEELKKFYNKVRKQSINSENKMIGMPITPRHAQGIIRMAEAHAKLRLSEYVEIQDFRVAEDLFYESLLKIGMDEEGTIDVARFGSSVTLSKKKKILMYYDIIKEILKRDNKEILTDGEIRNELFKQNINLIDFNEVMSELNKEGYLIKNSDGWKII